MTEISMIQDVCNGVDTASMMRHIEEFAKRVKLSGSKEELESFRYIKARLDEMDLRTRLILHDAYISLPGKAKLAVGNEPSPDCITHSFSRASGGGGVRGRVVYAGYGTPADFAGIDAAGKIVLLEGIANPAASLRSSQAGAIGQIHISPLQHLYEMCISPIWGSPTPDQLALLPTTVVLSVRKPHGDALRTRILRGEEVDATLYAEVDTGWRQTPIIEANIDAPGAVDESFVMFSGHHDTWYYGVMDNGGANATMMEVARIFSQRRAELKRGLRICFWSGHSHGRYSGSSWYADAHFAELARNCVAHVNIDSVGAQGNTVLADALSSNELFAVAADAVRSQGGEELDGHRMSRAGDQSFWGIGIPSLFMAMGEQPAGAGTNVMGPAISGPGARKGAGFGWWWHTPDDTIDKIDPKLLERDAKIYVHAIGRLVADEVLPLDIARQADALSGELHSLAARLEDRLDLGALLSGTAALRQAATRIRGVSAGSDSSSAVSINRALLGATRALVPMDYTSGDRFNPDPALKQGPYPVLDPVRALAATAAGSDESRFAGVAARRALNRLALAIGEANDALARIA